MRGIQYCWRRSWKVCSLIEDLMLMWENDFSAEYSCYIFNTATSVRICDGVVEEEVVWGSMAVEITIWGLVDVGGTFSVGG